MSKLKWFNNGVKNTRAEICPEGFVEGKIEMAKPLDISSYDGVLKDLITNSIGDYYKNRIKVGSVVTIKESMDKFRTFYVVNLHDDCFEGIELKYERDFGLFIEGVNECLIPYGSVYDTIVYSEDFSEKVNNMVNEARLLLK